MHKYVYLDTYTHPLGLRNVATPLFNNVSLLFSTPSSNIVYMLWVSGNESQLMIGVTVFSVTKCNISLNIQYYYKSKYFIGHRLVTSGHHRLWYLK